MCAKFVLGQYQINTYLNSDAVQQALDLLEKVEYRAINFDFNSWWTREPTTWVPTSRELSKILDVKLTPVLVITGMNDITV